MNKLAISIILALSPLASKAGSNIVLDCQNLGDGVEYNVCETAQAPTCEKAAATAVQLIQQIRSGKKVVINYVNVIQEDESYEVGFNYVSGDVIPDISYYNEVFVSAGPGDCSVNSVR